MKRISESQIEEAILEYLNISGYFAWKNPSAGFHDGKGWRKQASRFAINGVADIISIKSGAVRFLEIKTDVGIQSEAQIAFEAKLELHGGQYFLVRSVKEVRELVKSGKI